MHLGVLGWPLEDVNVRVDPIRGAINDGSLPTPDWIREIMIRTPGCGWFRPIRLGAGHPVLMHDEPCFYCDEPFVEGDVVLVQPFLDDRSRWVVSHRHCVGIALGILDENGKPLPIDRKPDAE